MYVRIDQAGKNSGVAEIMDVRAGRYFRVRNDCLNLLALHQNGCGADSIGNDDPSGRRRPGDHGSVAILRGSGHLEPSVSCPLHFFNSPRSGNQAEKSLARCETPLILACFEAAVPQNAVRRSLRKSGP